MNVLEIVATIELLPVIRANSQGILAFASDEVRVVAEVGQRAEGVYSIFVAMVQRVEQGTAEVG